MLKLKRAEENPILSPVPDREWDGRAGFNPCVIATDSIYHLLYRAVSPQQNYFNHDISLSTIGHAVSTDGIHFTDRKQFIKPEYEWEFYGCEDPRVTKIDDKYYIFYTALSSYPFSASGIKVGLAITRDFQTIEERHLVTPFNAKAMCLFPEKVNGKLAAMVTVDTDQPPAKIGLAYFDKIEEMWDPTYWQNWYAYIQDHTVDLRRSNQDHVEIGAPPVKTPQGWLLIYSYIQRYFTEQKLFTVEAVTLQDKNPLKILARTQDSLLSPEEPYEKEGLVPNIVFPSGAVLKDDTLSVYYGGADMVSCLASCSLSALTREMISEKPSETVNFSHEIGPITFRRFEENPILSPVPDHPWETLAVFNPAAIYDEGKVRLVYRAVSHEHISRFGYAESQDGYHITNRSSEPVYEPHEAFEKNATGKNYGCEDPRITKIDDTYYICYTAYDGIHSPRVAFTSISARDFIEGRWNWTPSLLISPPDVDDKDACLFPKKINDKYVFLHRMNESIWLDQVDDLQFAEGKVITGKSILGVRPDKWDAQKVGIASPPLETKEGWLLLYHGIDRNNHYNVGALLMELDNPEHILARLDYPLFIPEAEYEKHGQVDNVVFPCGAVMIDANLLIYYGAADSVIGVASIEVNQLLSELIRFKS